MLNIQKLLATWQCIYSQKGCNSIKHITINVLAIIKLLDLLEHSFPRHWPQTITQNNSILWQEHLSPHAAPVPVLQLHLMKFRMLSSPGSISVITGAHAIFNFHFLIKFFHAFICKLWKKAPLGDVGKLAGFTFFFVFWTMSTHFACRICANDSDFSEYLKYKSDKVPKLLV